MQMARSSTAAPIADTIPVPRKIPVALIVNGEETALNVAPWTTLLDALRDHLGLTGTKKGCDHGQCGACTVLVNGVRMNACLSLAAQRDGDEIVTIEGLAPDGAMAALQAAFVHNDAFQCGYCTPGQIMSATGMLSELQRGLPSAATGDLSTAPAVNVEEVRERMSGNICRCAAYPNIVAAIMSTAAGVRR